MSELLAKLMKYQRKMNWTDGQMASRLGVSRPYWTQIRNRKFHLGERVLRGVVRTFPELSAEVLLFLGSEREELIPWCEIVCLIPVLSGSPERQDWHVEYYCEYRCRACGQVFLIVDGNFPRCPLCGVEKVFLPGRQDAQEATQGLQGKEEGQEKGREGIR